MSRRLPLLAAIVLSLLAIALSACGGGDEEEEGTQTPATPTATTAAQTPTKPAGGTPAAARTPSGPSFTGSAAATVKVGDKTFTFKNGKCDIAPDETWMVVNIGQPGDEYFGIVVGANPAAPEGARSVKGGGVFTDGEVALTVEQGGSSFLMGGIGTAAEANKVTLPADLSSGEFEGTTLDGQPISGSFQC